MTIANRVFLVIVICLASVEALWSCAAAPKATSRPQAIYGPLEPSHQRAPPKPTQQEKDEAKIKAKIDNLGRSIDELKEKVNSGQADQGGAVDGAVTSPARTE